MTGMTASSRRRKERTEVGICRGLGYHFPLHNTPVSLGLRVPLQGDSAFQRRDQALNEEFRLTKYDWASDTPPNGGTGAVEPRQMLVRDPGMKACLWDLH
jgi:hypothetical protein